MLLCCLITAFAVGSQDFVDVLRECDSKFSQYRACRIQVEIARITQRLAVEDHSFMVRGICSFNSEKAIAGIYGPAEDDAQGFAGVCPCGEMVCITLVVFFDDLALLRKGPFAKQVCKESEFLIAWQTEH